jgi:hypothetical protein
MITVNFVGGPRNGEVREEESPSEVIFPKGSPMVAVNRFFLDGVLECGCYVLDDKRSTYNWQER